MMRLFEPNSAQRRERAQVSNWARSLVANSATIFLDTETTGLDANAEIIDLAVVDLKGNILIDTLIRPVRSIPPETTRVHGLTDGDVIGAPSWGDVYPHLARLVGERPVVVYNVAFDRRMIGNCCRDLGIDQPAGEWHCAMQQYAAWAGVGSSRGKYRLHKLGDALAAFHLPPGNHRALGDAEACRALVYALATASV